MLGSSKKLSNKYRKSVNCDIESGEKKEVDEEERKEGRKRKRRSQKRRRSRRKWIWRRRRRLDWKGNTDNHDKNIISVIIKEIMKKERRM